MKLSIGAALNVSASDESNIHFLDEKFEHYIKENSSPDYFFIKLDPSHTVDLTHFRGKLVFISLKKNSSYEDLLNTLGSFLDNQFFVFLPFSALVTCRDENRCAITIGPKIYSFENIIQRIGYFCYFSFWMLIAFLRGIHVGQSRNIPHGTKRLIAKYTALLISFSALLLSSYCISYNSKETLCDYIDRGLSASSQNGAFGRIKFANKLSDSQISPSTEKNLLYFFDKKYADTSSFFSFSDSDDFVPWSYKDNHVDNHVVSLICDYKTKAEAPFPQYKLTFANFKDSFYTDNFPILLSTNFIEKIYGSQDYESFIGKSIRLGLDYKNDNSSRTFIIDGVFHTPSGVLSSLFDPTFLMITNFDVAVRGFFGQTFFFEHDPSVTNEYFYNVLGTFLSTYQCVLEFEDNFLKGGDTYSTDGAIQHFVTASNYYFKTGYPLILILYFILLFLCSFLFNIKMPPNISGNGLDSQIAYLHGEQWLCLSLFALLAIFILFSPNTITLFFDITCQKKSAYMIFSIVFSFLFSFLIRFYKQKREISR